MILFYLHITQMQVIRQMLAAREIDSPTIQLIDDDASSLTNFCDINEHFSFQQITLRWFTISFCYFYVSSTEKNYKIINFFILTTEFPNCRIKKFKR